jgi:acetyltransferase-like isoleucine patch superfamily enzyme
MKVFTLLLRMQKPWIVLLPWPLKRLLLQWLFRYKLAPTARIGLAWIFPAQLEMADHASIDHLCVAIHLDRIQLDRDSHIGRANWITGLSTKVLSRHFRHLSERSSKLHLCESARVTKNHHLDCSDSITIGPFTTVAGYGSQFLTHSIDLQHNRQHCAPIHIGGHCFVGTNVVVLGGSVLPSHSVLGACSLLNRPQTQPWSLYAGQPAQLKKAIDPEAAYFSRSVGFVD